jgi:two-component system CheB/CheR fusion protein
MMRNMASKKAAKPKVKAEKVSPIRAPKDESSERRCTIVGFGASAGGLEAFSDVLANTPTDAGIGMVFVQHLDPNHPSALVDLLGRSTRMQVQEAKDGMVVRPNNVYVIPPNSLLTLSSGALRIAPRAPFGPQMPVDVFFRSLAETEGGRSIGVILSGTASDGTLGLKAIKEEGGITFCQEPQSAKYDGMPRSAVAAGCVDFILSPPGIARELVRLCQHPYVAETKPEAEPAPRFDFTPILAMLKTTFSVDFSYYKNATIQRRILRRMAVNQVSRPDEYVSILRANRGELQSLFQDILINVTGFFREPGMFDFLKARIFPSLVHNRDSQDPMRVWIPGCSTGEEAYSVAICLLEYLRDNNLEFPVQFFGTDLNESALEKARGGLYPESIANEVSLERLRKFFIKVNGSYQVTRALRDLCIFARQDLVKDPPFSKLDLISCRNVLIYLGPVLQQKLMRMFHYALKPTGFLVLGISETVGGAAELFESIDRKQKFYTRKAVPSSLDFGIYREASTIPPPARPLDLSPTIEFNKRIDQFLLSRYSPPGVVVNNALKILQFRGRTAPYLEHTAGEANLNLLKMSSGGLGVEVRKLIRRAKTTDGTVRSKTLQMGQNDAVREVQISVTPIKIAGSAEETYVVLFEETPEGRPSKSSEPPVDTKAGAGPMGRRLKEIQKELSSTKLYLQSVIEEQEATTEELKSANEEIQSSNEELQSTNEELLTAKEELQSTNEELTTVNEEMQSRNAELTQINNDLNNLLSSVNIPIVMLGNDLRIRRFTPQAERVLNLLPTDIGRPIGDFKPKINVPELEKLFIDVLENLAVRESEVQDREGRYYSMWIRPYRTGDNKIDGAVMSLFDITERKGLAEARYRRLFEAARDGILIVDAKSGEILDANPFLTTLTGFQRAELIGKRLRDTQLLDTADLQEMTSALIESEAWKRSIELNAKGGARVSVEIVSNVYDEGGRRVIQLNVRDLSGRRVENRTAARGDSLRDLRQQAPVGRLAGILGRDFGNLLTAITGYASMMEQRLGAEHELSEEVSELKRAGERGVQITRQLLALGRTRATEPQILDLNEIAAEMEQIMRIMLPGNVSILIEPSHEPVALEMNRFDAEQIALELVVLAGDSMPHGGTLKIESTFEMIDEAFTRQHPAVPPGDYAVLRVTATAKDLHAEDGAAIETPFGMERARAVGGVKSLLAAVKQANGYLWSYTELGKGTTASVFFPRATDSLSSAPALGEMPKGSEEILLVDPDAQVRRVTAGILRGRGYTVHEAAAGSDALELVERNRLGVKLLLTEALMGEINGPELARRMGGMFSGKTLYMTGNTDIELAQYGLVKDGKVLLRKPFTPAELARAVRETIDR